MPRWLTVGGARRRQRMHDYTYRGIAVSLFYGQDKRYQCLIFFPDNTKRHTKMRKSINEATRDAMYWIDRWHIVGGAREELLK
jgi:hypothetical protein